MSITGSGLSKKPFYSFDFYTFETKSTIGIGPNPQFNESKQFAIDATMQFKKYMETQVLTIDLIDDAVDISKTAARDYIGSVRIPLREAFVKGRV